MDEFEKAIKDERFQKAIKEAVKEAISPQAKPEETELSLLKKILIRQDDQIFLLKIQMGHLENLNKIRWLIASFSVWFIVQAWFLPKILEIRW